MWPNNNNNNLTGGDMWAYGIQTELITVMTKSHGIRQVAPMCIRI